MQRKVNIFLSTFRILPYPNHQVLRDGHYTTIITGPYKATATMPRHHHPRHMSHSCKPGQKSTDTSGHESQFPDSIRSDPSLVHLDGRTLEGGGQLVRVALSLSALTNIPVHIHNIRGNRSSRSMKGGGLKSSHLAALEFLAGATAAKTLGASVGSTEVVFEPGRDKQLLRDRAKAGDEEGKGGTAYRIRLDKPGSVWLILQAILPYMIFAASEHVPMQLIVTGGTNVPKSMSGEYVKQVMCPTFEKIGLPTIELEIKRRGWTQGRAIQIGEVEIKVHALKRGAKLPPFELKERGAISRIAISVLAGTEAMRLSLVGKATDGVCEKYPQLEPPEIMVNEDSGDPKRLYLLLVAHTSNGYRLGRDWLYDEKIKGALNGPQIELIAEKIVQRVLGELAAEIAHGACVDEYMRDQLVVFQVLTDGRSQVDSPVGIGAGSLHTRTCRWVAEQVLADQASFDTEGGCQGVGFAVGEIFEQRKSMGQVILQKNEEQTGEGAGRQESINSNDERVGRPLVEPLGDLDISRG